MVEALAALPRVITSEMTRTIFFFLLNCIQILNQYELLSYRVNDLIRIRKENPSSMKTDVTYLYLEEIFITSISVPQTVVCFQLGFCIVTFDHFDHYIFHRSCEEMHREVRISTQLSAITFSIQLEFYL